MIYAEISLLCVVAIECFILLPIINLVKRLLSVSQKSVKVVTSPKISDHWKEIVLQRYARDMAKYSLCIGLGMFLVSLPVIAAAYLLDTLNGASQSVIEYTMTPKGLLFATTFSFFYIFLRRRIVPS